MRISYPSDVPQDSILDIVHLFRDGQVVEQRALFANAIWNVQGYLQGILLGNPFIQKREALPLELAALAPVGEPLYALCDCDCSGSCDHVHKAMTDVTDVGAIPWASIMQMAQGILAMLIEMGIFKKPVPAPLPQPSNPNNVVKEQAEPGNYDEESEN
jgi:hypothetical protein